MKTQLIIKPVALLFFCLVVNAAISFQRVFTSENRANLDSIKIKSQFVSVFFWNVENLYDPYDDTTRMDDEFTPGGAKRWSWSKLSLKLNHVAKTLLAAGGWDPPSVVGLCEVENRYILNRLINDTPLKKSGYRCIHQDSPDLRGVDVAFLYRPDRFRPISHRSIPIRYPFDTTARTRDILYIKGMLFETDTISFFINHWPSRRGGQQGSQPRRNHVASVLRQFIDTLLLVDPAANILVMGDFNDEPEDESLKIVLAARTDTLQMTCSSLYNLMGIRNRSGKEGTLRYRDQWSTFDQFIVSGSLLLGKNGLKADAAHTRIFRSGFLLEEDAVYFGEKLNRTYLGPRYHGGFSDHLPVCVEIVRKKR